jgi:hypothetical protein
MTRPMKRSFTIKGHRTSISVEAAFWEALQQAAAGEQQSLAGLIAAIDAKRGDAGRARCACGCSTISARGRSRSRRRQVRVYSPLKSSGHRQLVLFCRARSTCSPAGTCRGAGRRGRSVVCSAGAATPGGSTPAAGSVTGGGSICAS